MNELPSVLAARDRCSRGLVAEDDELASWIADLAARSRPDTLVRLRHDAEQIAGATGTETTIGLVSDLIGAALGTRAVVTGSQTLRAQQDGRPYDRGRIAKFEILAEHLGNQAPSPIERPTGRRSAELPFFEAYFSNFIEGTVLTLDEAQSVMYGGEDLPGHPEDAHDVSATFRLASDPDEARAVPRSADELADLLRHRHRHLMAARPNKHPNEFKVTRNQVGRYVFVRPDQVDGTIRAGWDPVGF